MDPLDIDITRDADTTPVFVQACRGCGSSFPYSHDNYCEACNGLKSLPIGATVAIRGGRYTGTVTAIESHWLNWPATAQVYVEDLNESVKVNLYSLTPVA